jgi:hypothetical protein
MRRMPEKGKSKKLKGKKERHASEDPSDGTA